MPEAAAGSPFDAEPHPNLPNGFLSVKTVHLESTPERTWVEMADASRVWLWPRVISQLAHKGGPEAYVKLVVGCWFLNSATNIREVVEIHEMDFCLGDLFVRGRLYGQATLEDVYSAHVLLHKGLLPSEDAANALYEQNMACLAGRFGAIQPSRKVDSQQRRVQCKARLSDLIQIATRYTLHRTNSFYGVELPLPLAGLNKRVRKTKEQKKQLALAAAHALLAANGMSVQGPLDATTGLVQANAEAPPKTSGFPDGDAVEVAGLSKDSLEVSLSVALLEEDHSRATRLVELQ